VGGPDTAGGGGEFLRDFLEHCLRGTNHATGAKGTPTDFLAFHAKGQPKYLDGHVQMGIARHLQTIDGAMAIIASFREFKKTPIVIGESDPEGCAACQGPQLGYRNGTMYSSYTAASFARKHDLAEKHGVNLEGALTWAFEFEDQPYFAGFRALASNGIDLAVLNVFRMFGKMGGRRLGVQSSGEIALDAIVKDGVRGAPDVSALASLEGKKLSVMLWHYHDDDLPGPDAAVDLTIAGLPLPSGEARVTHFRIDDGHSNPYAVWNRMGSPIAPNADQYKELQAASGLARLLDPATARVEKGQASLRFSLPRQAVSLVVLEW
jgi:xylan 1,4-beta-xylosidase